MPTLQKEQIVKDLTERVAKANMIALADYSELDVEQITDLRRKLRETDAEMKVIKNNLIRLALKDTDWAAAGEDLHGPTAITLGYGEAAAPAKVLEKFAKRHPKKKPDVKKIGFEAEVYGAEFLKQLAAMPTREEALSMLAGVLSSIIAGSARVLNAVKDKMEEQGVEKAGDLLAGAAPAEEAPAEEPAAEAPAEAPAEQPAEGEAAEEKPAAE